MQVANIMKMSIAVMIAALLMVGIVAPMIDAASRETTTITNEGAGDLRYTYAAEPVDYSSTIVYNDVSDEITAGFGSSDLQTIAAVKSIIWASNIGSIIFNGATFYLMIDDGKNVVNVDLGDGCDINVNEGVVSIAAANDTVYSGAITWSYSPQKNGQFGFFTDSGATVKDFPVATAGTFAGAYAYNSINSLGLSTLAPTYSVTDGVFTTGPWTVPDLGAKVVKIPEKIEIEEKEVKENKEKETAIKAIVQPSTGTLIGNLYYSFSGTSATVEGISSSLSSATSIVVPATVTNGGNTYNVTALYASSSSNSGVFSGLTSLQSVTLPDSLTSLGRTAFYGCTNLTEVNIPSGVTKIDRYTFKGCSSLALESLPDGITTIGYEAFKGCSSLALESLPDGITTIGYEAFEGCSSLAIDSLPSGLTTVDSNTFDGCSSIANMTLPSGLTQIKSAAFRGTGISQIIIPASVTAVGDSAFYGCPNLSKLIVLGSPSFAYNTFADITHVTEVLNLGNTEINAGDFGIKAEAVVNDEIPSLGYMAPATFSETVQKTGTLYTVMGMLPVLMLAGVLVMTAAAFINNRRA